MTQKTEQKVRTREEQVKLLSDDLAGIRCPELTDHQCALRHILEAEARGAEEQRRKDAELSRAKLFCRDQKDASDRTPERADVVQWQKDRNEFFLSSTLEVVTEYAAWRDTKDAESRDTPSAYVRPDDFYNDERNERCGPWSGDQIGEYTLPLYTRPANVAALEARIAELEEAATDAIALIRAGRPVLARTALCRVTTDHAALTRDGGE